MMTRRDFEAMASNYADSFNRIARNGDDFVAFGIVWDNMLGFTGIAAESNPNFRREQFLKTIEKRLREIHGGVGLPAFSRKCWSRFGF